MGDDRDHEHDVVDATSAEGAGSLCERLSSARRLGGEGGGVAENTRLVLNP